MFSSTFYYDMRPDQTTFGVPQIGVRFATKVTMAQLGQLLSDVGKSLNDAAKEADSSVSDLAAAPAYSQGAVGSDFYSLQFDVVFMMSTKTTPAEKSPNKNMHCSDRSAVEVGIFCEITTG